MLRLFARDIRRLVQLTAVMAFAFFCAALAPMAAAQEPRLALIIGNDAYAAATPLEASVADADLIEDALEEQGFNVTLIKDASQIALNRAIAQFGRDLRAAGPEATGLFYYAGHTVQALGNNYLLPIDAEMAQAADLNFVAVNAQAVLQQMFSAKNRANIVILDASRQAPFPAITEVVQTGLAEMRLPPGTFLSYSSQPGAFPAGAGGNSPFATALAQEVSAAERPIEEVFANVAEVVRTQTNGQQAPWSASSLTNDFVFSVGLPSTEDSGAAEPAPTGTELTWDTPFTTGGDTIRGRSIMELVEGEALFPPIEGLPDELWKEQSCTNCHQWTKEALCTQGQTYVSNPEGGALSKPHPYGGVFKENVRLWAEGGCK